ncbi:MAG TPA: DNA polymerase III subunit alpha [Anaerolineae bacterium]|nr:DNA polymerase III subunit alpha [Anaerolineae bacterium]
MAEFVHLHVHSDYSLLDGMAKPDRLASTAAAMGMPALALTDHGVMFGALHFYDAAKKAGIRPIIGCEMYVSPRRMTQKDPQFDTRPTHIVLLAEDQAGYHNLMQIATAAQLDGFYYRPRIDHEYLAEHAQGLIALSSCGSGEVPRRLQEGLPDRARRAAEWYREVFGPNGFFLELQEHDIPEMVQVNRDLVELSRQTAIPLVATNDVHYLRQGQAKAHDVLLCIGTGKTVKDPSRMQMNNDSYYMRSPEEMAALFAGQPEALRNTLAIAERCSVNLDFGEFHLPQLEVPEGTTAETYLRRLTEAGLRQRYGDEFASEQVQARMAYELGTIHEMGFDVYLLIVWDLCQFAWRQDIWWNARGSAAGSIVAYGLGITSLDPLAHGLMFERFLNPYRVSMPDIDLDFPDERREEMIRYTVRKYGVDKVAQIITFGTLGAKAALRDVGRALDIPLGEVDAVARLVPAGPHVTLEDALAQVPELKQKAEEVDYINTLVETARELEGVSRHASTHAAGVVVTDKPVVEYTPLHRATRGAEEGLPVTQYTMDVLESTGLLKIDFLGLSTLTIMRKAVDLIRQRHGKDFAQHTIPVNDPATFRLLSSGEVSGLFQVESSGMRRVLTSMQPTRFEHIVAVLALYRPGPMEFIDDYVARMRGQKPPEYDHPTLEPILGETFGVCVYQEQLIRILTDIAGYHPGEADTVRRAVGKKHRDELVVHRAKFVEGARAHSGLDEAAGNRIFDAFEYFARYGFNKSHSADYAYITCQTAYLKAYYPVEYMAALLTVERGNTEKIGVLIAEARRLGIDVLPPNVNHSGLDFTIEDEHQGAKGPAIRYGLGAIKNVGEGAVETILEARRSGGDFRDIDDFCHRVDLGKVNRRALESLIKAGAMASFGSRTQLLHVLDRMMSISQQAQGAARQFSMFDMPGFAGTARLAGDLPQLPDAARKEVLAWEKELVGAYISDHPLSRVWTDLERAITVMTGQIDESMAGQKVTVAGIVNAVRQTITKKGDAMAFAQIEDLQGTVEVVLFPRIWAATKELWQPERILIVRGTVNARGREPSIAADSATNEITIAQEAGADDSPPQPPVRAGPVHLHITISRSGDMEQVIHKLGQVYDLLQRYRGQDRFSLYVDNGGRGRVLMDFPNNTTRHCLELEQELRALVGAAAIQIEGMGPS